MPDVLLMDRDLALLVAAPKVFLWPTTLLLCIWHVKTNVRAHASTHIKDETIKTEFLKDWTSLIASKTINAYDHNWIEFQTKYGAQFPALVQYVLDTWLRKYKSYFVSAWVDKKLHLGNHATSRAEGAHGVLKKYLQVSTGDLKTVYDRVSLLLINQHVEFEAAIAHNRTHTPHTARHLFYAPLLNRVSNYALGKLWEQRQRLSNPDPLPRCTGTFTKTMGLPCAHQMQDRFRDNGTLLLADIHAHWYLLPLAPAAAEPLILEPAVAKPRGRPAADQEFRRRPLNRATRAREPISSTRRNPSAFELAELPVRNRTRRGNAQ
jgi:hypothetical protein